MRWIYEGHWVPAYVAPLLLMLSGISLILQQKAAARALFLLGIGAVIMPVAIGIATSAVAPVGSSFPQIISALIGSNGWPPWMIWIVAIVLLAAAPFILLRLLLGRAIWENMMGQLAADAVVFFFKLPFKAIGWIWRKIF